MYEEENRKARKRMELNQKLSAARNKLSQITSCENTFNFKKAEGQRLVERWQNKKTSAFRYPIVSSVEINHIFEGNIANKMKTELFEGNRTMDENISKLSQIISGINEQLNQLDRRRRELEYEIRNIQNELNRL